MKMKRFHPSPFVRLAFRFAVPDVHDGHLGGGFVTESTGLKVLYYGVRQMARMGDRRWEKRWRRVQDIEAALLG